MLLVGFEFYGFGYFLSAVTTFAVSVLVLFSHIRQLPYHAFITNNNSIRSKVKVDALKEHSKVW